MLELAADLLPLLRAGERVAVVTVARVARSAPRGAGAAMAVTADARVIGSISGGCVESDAVSLALAALARDRGTSGRLGFSDEQAFAAGLACGGSIDAVISVLHPDDHVVIDALETAQAGGRAAVAVVATGPRIGEVIDPVVVDGVTAGSETRMLEAAYEGADVLLVRTAPPPKLILLGAGEHAAALCRLGTAAGFAVTVCDVWDLLTTRERFPDAAELVTAIPAEHLASLGPDEIDERTAVCVLTHDVRLDIPALRTALRMPVGFVGAMGARSTVARRAELLRAEGVTDTELARLHSPLGLDLGGTSPEHTAIAVLAEIVAVRHGRDAQPLRDGVGPLHARVAPDAGATVAASACSVA
ncbi:XdhC family protein [Microbacterium sp. GXF7504]